jgi:hypothetical protein
MGWEEAMGTTCWIIREESTKKISVFLDAGGLQSKQMALPPTTWDYASLLLVIHGLAHSQLVEDLIASFLIHVSSLSICNVKTAADQ